MMWLVEKVEGLGNGNGVLVGFEAGRLADFVCGGDGFVSRG